MRQKLEKRQRMKLREEKKMRMKLSIRRRMKLVSSSNYCALASSSVGPLISAAALGAPKFDGGRLFSLSLLWVARNNFLRC